VIDLAVILAAGGGSRLQPYIPVPHKALVPIGGQPLLARTCRILDQIGLAEIIVVTGYRGAAVRSALGGLPGLNARLTYVDNERWDQANGLSVLAAAERLGGDYLLLMADHLFDPGLLRAMVHADPGTDRVVLAVDRKLESIYDMDDATKVRVEGHCIVDIGKELVGYNAIDAGLFACSGALVESLRAVLERKGDCSLTDGVRPLAALRRFHAFDIGDSWWQDIDTPGALEYGARLLQEHPVRD
jgi:1L-myo-inositol 1-phosphate cytidylyltransferase